MTPYITTWYEHEHKWWARLSCGHVIAIRHRPPYRNRPWVLSEAGREGAIGRPWRCRECGA